MRARTPQGQRPRAANHPLAAFGSGVGGRRVSQSDPLDDGALGRVALGNGFRERALATRPLAAQLASGG
jgi:hypothetical protein